MVWTADLWTGLPLPALPPLQQQPLPVLAACESKLEYDDDDDDDDDDDADAGEDCDHDMGKRSLHTSHATVLALAYECGKGFTITVLGRVVMNDTNMSSRSRCSGRSSISQKRISHHHLRRCSV